MSRTRPIHLFDPAEPAPRTCKGRKLPVPLRWPDALNLLAVCRHEQAAAKGSRRRAAQRDEIVLYLGLYLGLRNGEICAIAVEDFDFAERTARVNQGKGHKDRVVPIPKAAFDVLHAWAKRRKCGLFLPNHLGNQFDPRVIHWRIQRLGKAAGLPWLHPHSLRHGCATRLLATGMDVRRIQKFLGHASLSTTALYLDVLPVDLREGADRM
jgi:integrase